MKQKVVTWVRPAEKGGLPERVSVCADHEAEVQGNARVGHGLHWGVCDYCEKEW